MKHQKQLKEYLKNYQDDMKLFQDAFLRERLLGSRELSHEKLQLRMSALGIQLHGPLFCVVIFAPYLMEKEADEIDESLVSMLSEIQKGYHNKNIQCHTISDGYCNAIAVLSFQKKEELQIIEKVASELAEKIIVEFDTKLFVGIGKIVRVISDLNKSRLSAAEALGYKYTFSQGCVINAKDVERYYNQGNIDLKQHYDWILGCFYDGNLGRMSERMTNLRIAVATTSKDELHSMKNIFIELTAAIQRRIYEMGIKDVYETSSIYTDIAKMGSVEEIEQWFSEHCFIALQKISDLRADKSRQIIRCAEEYVKQNLSNRNLSIQMISDYVELSPAYFSSIFYQETKKKDRLCRSKRIQSFLVGFADQRKQLFAVFDDILDHADFGFPQRESCFKNTDKF